jgi:hypothetical protein
MALFADGPPSSIDDLNQQDSFLLMTATTEGIDVTTKLQLAYIELQIELTSIFSREASIYAPVLGQAPLDTNHLAVTTPLKLWHSFKSLEAVYRDAYFSQLNDRYKGKWAEYQSLSQWSRGKFIEAGAGLVIDPLPQPSGPIISLQTASQSGGTVYVTISFINAEGGESSPAAMTPCMIPDGNVLTLSSPPWPANATGWNVYGGATPTGVTLQTPTPLTLGASWQFILPGAVNGALAGTGQSPNVVRDLPRRIMRG